MHSLPNAKIKMESDRFEQLSEAKIKTFSEEHENVNTKKTTLYTQKLFKKLLTSEDKRRELQEIPAAELQQFAIKFVQSFCLCNFFSKKITRWLEEINCISSR